jgi:carotenoid isomerooxygenase
MFSVLKLKPNSSTDNTAVNICPIGNDFYAFTETPKINKFDTTTLETLERVCLGQLANIVIQPAHPIATEDGCLYNVGMNMTAAGATYVLFCIPNVENKFDNIKVLSKFSPKRKNYPSYMHSFAITENYFVVVESPFTISTFELAKSLIVRTNFFNTFKWFENEPSYIHLIDRKTGKIMHTFETETFFFFHTINAYEESDQVILDLICYKGPDIIESMLIENIKNLQKNKMKCMASRPLRFVFPLNYSKGDATDKNLIKLPGSDAKAYMQSSGTVLCFPELLCDLPFEFGTLYSEKHYGKKYRYFYGVGMDMYTEFPGQLIKVDTFNKSVLTWHQENAYTSEPLFVPSPNTSSEDDGVLVSALLRGQEDTNCIGLLVLDAKTMKEIGRCDFRDLPTPIPKILHGWFLE